MDKEVCINIGEIIRDFCGEYRMLKSGDIPTEIVENNILKDTIIGENADDNIIVNMGLADKLPYLWVIYTCRNSEEGVSIGRSHAVYTECSFKSLYLFNSLLCFPFADSTMSHKLVKGEAILTEGRVAGLNGVENEKLIDSNVTVGDFNCNESISIDRKLLSALVSYILKKRRNRFSNFLYILVPDSVTKYQNYCISALITIFNAIPLGLRKQFKIATNATVDNEENYHILFCRESIFKDREKKDNAVNLESDVVPQFMLNERINEKYAEFIKLCVANPQHSKIDMIDKCYEEMEKYKNNISSLGENDYIVYYDNVSLELELQRGNITSELLKQCNEKLGSDISENEKEILKKQIKAAISDISNFEKVIERTAQQPVTFEALLAWLNQYKNVFDCLNEKNVFLSNDFLFEKLRPIRINIEINYENVATQSVKEQELDKLHMLKNKMLENRAGFVIYFGTETIDAYINSIDEKIKNIDQEYPNGSNDFLAYYERKFSENGSVELLKGLCYMVKKTNPEQIRLFCSEINFEIFQNQEKYSGTICALIDVIKNSCSDIAIVPALYDSCEREIYNYIQDNKVSEDEIDEKIDWISNIFGEEVRISFTQNLIRLFIQLSKKGIKGEGWCAQLDTNDIPFNKYKRYSNELSTAIDGLCNKKMRM